MRLDGKLIADSILARLKTDVSNVTRRGIRPTLAVILVGDNPASLSYIKQKQKAAEKIGATVVFEHLPQSTTKEHLASTIARYNNVDAIHGLIVQHPVPIPNVQEILQTVAPKKDVDGFLPNSPFRVPVARAVITILEQIHHDLQDKNLIRDGFVDWLTCQSIAIIGRGETAGKPIARALSQGCFAMTSEASQQQPEIVRRFPKRLDNQGCATSVIHSQTPHPVAILKRADIIISCVGKKGIIAKRTVKPGAILISVGLWRDHQGKLRGDYEEDAIKDIASFYTPTPGGVGPVNVASLMQNLIEAVELQKG